MAHMKIVGKENHTPAYRARLKLAMEAHERGCIIFSHDTKKWYTPREFLDSEETVAYRKLGLNDYANHTLMYPKSAIEFHLEAIHTAEQQFQEFMKRMLTAFNINPKQNK